MTPRKRQRLSPEPLRVTNPHAAGIDVHANVHWVAVSPADAPAPLPTIRPTYQRMCVTSAPVLRT